MKVIFFVTLIFFSMNLFSNEKKAPAKYTEKEAAEDPSLEFKDTKFLQIDRVSVPSELKKIEEQVRQNLVDVILISKTHTPIYSQKRDGYSDSYKKFFGLQVRISPIPGSPDLYEVNYFYYNWLTNKMDKTLYKRISKFNVLNEVRFGVYELLFGKSYVQKNRDALDVQNYERIQAVRASIEEQKKIEKKNLQKNQVSNKEDSESSSESKKKKKLIREDKERERKAEATPVSNVSGEEPSKINPSESQEETATEETESESVASKNVTLQGEKKSKPKKTTKKEEDIKKSDPTFSVVSEIKKSQEDPDVKPSIKYGTQLYGILGPSYEYTTSVTSDNKVLTNTSVKYLCLGGDVEVDEEKEFPMGYTVKFKFGIPFMKDNYSLPLYKNIDLQIHKKYPMLPKAKFGIGLNYSPLSFVNVPNFGENLQVFENNFVWLKSTIGHETTFKERELKIYLSYLLGLMGNSNQKKSLNGSRIEILGTYMLNQKIGIEASFQTSSLTGDLTVNSKIAQIHMLYKFEN